MKRIVQWSVIGLALLWSLAPIAWMVTTSFKSALEATRPDPTLLPEVATFENYRGLAGGSLPFLSFFVNTASVPVLQTLGEGVTRAQAESLWQEGHAQRGAQFWNDSDMRQIPLDPQIFGSGASRASGYFGVGSSYFLARADIRLDDIPFTFFSVIERAAGSTRVIERSRGSDDALVAAVPEPDRR